MALENVANTFTATQQITGNLVLSGSVTGPTDWVDIPFSAADFYGLAPMVWTVDAGDPLVHAYVLYKKTFTYFFSIAGTAISGTVNNGLRINLPFIAKRTILGLSAVIVNEGVFSAGYVNTVAGSNVLSISKIDISNFLAGSATSVYGQITFEIQ